MDPLISGLFALAGTLLGGCLAFVYQYFIEKKRAEERRREMAVKFALAEWERHFEAAKAREERGVISAVPLPAFFLASRLPALKLIMDSDFSSTHTEEFAAKLDEALRKSEKSFAQQGEKNEEGAKDESGESENAW